MRGVTTFGGFNIARLGIMASQKALDVTGNNISNINTFGYTRQRLDQISFRVGGNNLYQSPYDSYVGSGVLCTGVSQLRDPYLDICFRNENANVGFADAKLAGLQELSAILDEVGDNEGKGIIEAAFNDFFTQLENLSAQGAGKDNFDSLAKASANSLVQLFNYYSSKLDEVADNQLAAFQQDVETVNSLLKNIASLNDTIKKSEIHGDPALELRDSRNNMLDELSSYIKVTVSYESESVGAGQSVENMIIRLGNTVPGSPSSGAILVNGSYATELGIRPMANPDYVPGDGSLPYLDANGDPTDDISKAADNPNYDLDLSILQNGRQQAYESQRIENTTDKPADWPADWGDPGFTNPVVQDDGGGLRTTTEYSIKNIKGVDHYIKKTTTTSVGVELQDNDLHGALQAGRETLTEKGEFSTLDEMAASSGAATKRGIPYYRNTLDALAGKFAQVMNKANQGYAVDTDGNYVNAAGDIVVKKLADGTYANADDGTILYADKAAVEAEAEALGLKGLGGVLFSSDGSGNNPDGITAGNISISHSWALNEGHIQNSFMVDPATGEPISGDNSNLLHLVHLMNQKFDYAPTDVPQSGSDNATVYITGTFQEMLSNICSTLANDTRSTNTLLDNYVTSATSISSSRDSVSAVDLNDEAANLMQYQKSYSAACRVMTTMDELLDKLINGTGTVGR